MKDFDNKNITIIIFVLAVVVIIVIATRGGEEYELPNGDTVTLEEFEENPVTTDGSGSDPTSNGTGDDPSTNAQGNSSNEELKKLSREIFVTDGTKHSIPLEDIRGGGPGKDGIPSIDNPKFVKTGDASFITDESIGLGLSVNNVSKFYPYSILVWHEIANDKIGGKNVVVTYCPLCGTGIVFDSKVDGKSFEFGVSGKLWQSNLLMYDRTGDSDTESLWSQVLGEAVVGPETGTKLAIIPSDTVRFGSWKSAHPDTLVLSTDTGASRDYNRDPYGSYYTEEELFFEVDNTDDRLHSKTLVAGIEVNGTYKAYEIERIPTGTTNDTVGGENLVITKDKNDIVRIRKQNGEEIEIVRGFWFSWVSVHPSTELFGE